MTIAISTANWLADVLMVMHTHRLNPRAYLEDTMRHGLAGLWNSNMPWELINKAINDKFEFTAAPEVQAAWVAKTNRNWDNQDDPLTKTLKCPYCPERYQAPWTTCGKDEKGTFYRYAIHAKPSTEANPSLTSIKVQ